MKIENIKFKAKRLDNNSWVFGYFYEENGNTYIIENRQKESMLNRNVTYEVDPATVCQFTGQFDIYRNFIYEHDLIKCEEADAVYEVVWDEGDASFNLINTQNACLLPATLGNWLRLQSFKVISNKFN